MPGNLWNLNSWPGCVERFKFKFPTIPAGKSIFWVANMWRFYLQDFLMAYLKLFGIYVEDPDMDPEGSASYPEPHKIYLEVCKDM